MKGQFRKKVSLEFCVTSNSDSKTQWPAGDYCIYRSGSSCPSGRYRFQEEFIEYLIDGSQFYKVEAGSVFVIFLLTPIDKHGKHE